MVVAESLKGVRVQCSLFHCTPCEIVLLRGIWHCFIAHRVTSFLRHTFAHFVCCMAIAVVQLFPGKSHYIWNDLSFVHKKRRSMCFAVIFCVDVALNVPELHVRMLFSTQFWSCDQHSLPVIHYLHSGADVIWCVALTCVFFSVLLSASLYVSKRGAYWDRLCRDVVGRWLVGWLSHVCTVAKRCILGL